MEVQTSRYFGERDGTYTIHHVDDRLRIAPLVTTDQIHHLQEDCLESTLVQDTSNRALAIGSSNQTCAGIESGERIPLR